TPSAAVGSGLSNYNISYHDASVGLTVNAIALDITADNQSKNYGATFTFTGTEFTTVMGQLKNSDSVTSVTLTSAGAAATATVAGSPYAITPSAAVGGGLSKNNISYHDASVGLTVNAIALDITHDHHTKLYGSTFTFTGTEFTTVMGQLKNSDSVTSVTLTSAGAAATANVAGSPYAITPSAATGTGLGNYTISYHNAPIGLTVNKANATVMVDPYNVTFDGNPHTATVASINGGNGQTNGTVGTVDVSNTTHTAPR